VDADEIVVAAGTYFETIDLLGKAIWLHSSDGPEVTIVDAQQSGTVVSCGSGAGPDTVLEGLTITGGYSPVGGGMNTGTSSPTVRDCTFTGNVAFTFEGQHGFGGGLANFGSFGSPRVIDCTFIDNISSQRGGGMSLEAGHPVVSGCVFEANTAAVDGGGIYNTHAILTMTGCTFNGNFADRGGAMYNSGWSPTVAGCVFQGNTADAGGGMYNYGGRAVVTGCRFIGNSASGGGGAMLMTVGAAPEVVNCTFMLNWGGTGGAIYCCCATGHTSLVANCTFSQNSGSGGAVTVVSGGDMRLANCILWDNSPNQILWGAPLQVRWSDVQGGWAGPGNIDADPLFADPDTGDYRLSPGSACIDAGHNWALEGLATTDLDGNPRFADDADTADTGCGVPVVVDMGAYEYPGEPFPVRFGDVNGDGAVSVTDFLLLLAAWGMCPQTCCLASLDLNGYVGVDDFLILLANWG
jgi:predicted outer membrane repeat protein